jgi:hypothetical protein
MWAARMFHSFGTLQSKSGVPVGTSCTWMSTCFRIKASVALTPSPVMLRQIGNISPASA